MGVLFSGVPDEDVVLPAVALPIALALFPELAFCARTDIVMKFSAVIIPDANMAATMKPSNLRIFCMVFLEKQFYL